MLEPGVVRRDGPEVQMVQRLSAQLYLPFEYRIPVNKNHTEMVKFATPTDPTYQTVVKHMRECIAKSKFNVTPDQLLEILSKTDQARHKPRVRSLDFDPKFFWVFKNMDFNQWRSADRSQVLLLYGPPECRMREASSHIVDLANVAPESGREHTVLYFFCSSMATEESVATTVVLGLLQQIISSLVPEKQVMVISSFLHSLSRAANRERLQVRGGESLDKIVEVLNTLGNAHWDALKAVFDSDIGLKPVLFLIIEGLDKIEHQRSESTKNIRALIEHLQERSWIVKALLTSRPHTKVKEILDGLPCIEYDKERKECLHTLRFENTRYGNIEEEHEGSLQWLWGHEEYRAWSSTNSSSLLLVEGKPGSGKSTLAKYFKCNFLKHEPLAGQAIVGGFFYSHREGELQTDHSSMLRSVLYDVLHHDESFFFHFQPYYRKALESASGSLFQWLYVSLKEILASLGDHPIPGRLIFVVDALDESTDKDRLDIVKLLGRVCSTKGACAMKVFLLSRPISVLNRRILSDYKIIKLQDVNSPDISKFAEAFLRSFPHEICHQATEYIVKNAQGVFIWVRLVKEELHRYMDEGYSNEEIFDLLTSLPTELEEFYERILKKLEGGRERDIRDGLKMFRLIIYARRPLGLEELRQAFIIPDDPNAEFSASCANESFDNKCIQGIDKRLIHCGGNFLEIKGAHVNSIVQVMHHTVREFFLRPYGLVEKSKFRIDYNDAQLRMSIICIRYLMMCAANTTLAVRLPNIDSEHLGECAQFLNKRPFINYALSHMKQHLKNCNDQSVLNQLFDSLATQPANSPASYLLESWSDREPTDSARDFRNRMLHTASRRQFSGVIETFMIAGAEVDAYEDGRTSLMVSAELGDVGTAQVLLSRGASIRARNSKGQTVLHLAAANGHNTMLKFLVDCGAYKEAEDNKGWTALHHATDCNYPATVRLLVDLGAYREAKGADLKTALHIAAQNGNDAMVQLLVQTLGADKEARDKNKRTACHLAAAGKHDSTVQLLVQTLGTDIEARDHDGRAALHLAAASGHDTTVQLLVQTLGADHEARDINLRTALHSAAAGGHDSTVQLFVQTLGADKEAKDNYRRTALHLAAAGGHDSTVQLLAQTLGADREARDTSMRTALHSAAAGGHDTTIQLLVRTLGVDREAKDIAMRTTLHLAAAGGHDTTVQLLVQTLGADQGARDITMKTAFNLAAAGGHDTTAQLLDQTLGAGQEASNIDLMAGLLFGNWEGAQNHCPPTCQHLGRRQRGQRQ